MRERRSRLTALVAAHQEDSRELTLCLHALSFCDERIVLASPGDERPVFFDPTGWHEGVYQHETEKRNALLKLAPHRGNEDWLLFVDPDEQLVNGPRLRLLLECYNAKLPAYPLLRQEPHGKLWAMPCKCLRASVDRFDFLDLWATWHSERPETWDLDPWELGRGLPIPGWPLLVHFPSPRARQPGPWYQGTPPPLVPRAFPRDEPPGYTPLR